MHSIGVGRQPEPMSWWSGWPNSGHVPIGHHASRAAASAAALEMDFVWSFRDVAPSASSADVGPGDYCSNVAHATAAGAPLDAVALAGFGHDHVAVDGISVPQIDQRVGHLHRPCVHGAAAAWPVFDVKLHRHLIDDAPLCGLHNCGRVLRLHRPCRGRSHSDGCGGGAGVDALNVTLF